MTTPLLPTATTPLPYRSPCAPAPKLTLAAAVAESRWPRNRAVIQLEPHREELLRLRQAGESVAALRAGLRKIEVVIGDEALRLWLNRELGHTVARRRRTRSIRATKSDVAPDSEVPATAEPTLFPIATPFDEMPVAAPPTASAINSSLPAAKLPESPRPVTPPLPWPYGPRRPRIARDDF